MNETPFNFGEAELARLRELWLPGAEARNVAQILSDEFGGVLSQQHFEEMLAQEGLPPIEEIEQVADAAPGADGDQSSAAPVARRLPRTPAPGKAPEGDAQ